MSSGSNSSNFLLGKLSYWVTHSRFLNRWVVLLLDLFLATAAGFFVYTVAAYLIDSDIYIKLGLSASLLSFITSLISFTVTGTYRAIVRYTTAQEMWELCYAIAIKMALEIPVLLLLRQHMGFYSFISNAKILLIEILSIGTTLSVLFFSRFFMVALFRYSQRVKNIDVKNVLIYGTDTKSVSAIQYLEGRQDAGYKVYGVLQFSDNVSHHMLAGKRVYYIKSFEYLGRIVEKHKIKAIVFPTKISAINHKDNLIPFATRIGLKIFSIPDTSEIGEDTLNAPLREIKVEDLLGRDEVEVDMDSVANFLKGKRVMVTGAAGSIGSELCRLISGFEIEKLVMLDNAETPMHNLELEFKEIEKKHYDNLSQKEDPIAIANDSFADRFEFFICDVRNRIRLERAFNLWHPQIIFHAAAYKHVPLMELNPTEAVRVNVFGTQNIAQLAVHYGVEKMIMVSTDKAVNPTNVMGASKRIAEIYTQSLSRAIINREVAGSTKFITTRFGNVLGSNGSVIPLFKEQIAAGGPVTVTHKDIVRYFMSIPEACRLVLEAATLGKGYEIFVFDMGQPVKIADLAESMIRLAGYTPGVDIQIQYTGLRPGEKLYEELLNTKENTLPTENKKIFLAKVREFPYSEVEKNVEDLVKLATKVDIIETVRKMKEMVPEYKSKNSMFEQLDRIMQSNPDAFGGKA